MADVNLFDEHPWCNGRSYCNAPPQAKTRCLVRPPPHWWLVELAGAVAPWEWLNTTHVLPIWKTLTGKDPPVWWAPAPPNMTPYQLQLTWQRNIPADPDQFYMVVGLDIARNLINATSWRSGFTSFVHQWTDYDNLVMLEQVRSPLWQAGDITCRLHLGTYDRLPAHSCRGDYGGVWP